MRYLCTFLVPPKYVPPSSPANGMFPPLPQASSGATNSELREPQEPSLFFSSSCDGLLAKRKTWAPGGPTSKLITKLMWRLSQHLVCLAAIGGGQ